MNTDVNAAPINQPVLIASLLLVSGQHSVVAKVDARIALCDQLEVLLTTADATRALLLEVLVNKALGPATLRIEAAE